MAWAVCQTEAQREATASYWLGRNGFETYLPRIKSTRRVIERNGHALIRTRIVPLFPSYLFVKIVDRWYAINSTIGVLQVLLDGAERPAMVAETEIQKIRNQERNGLVRLPEASTGFKRGDRLRVIASSNTLFNQIGLYENASGRDRVMALFSLLGRSTKVSLPARDVERVA